MKKEKRYKELKEIIEWVASYNYFDMSEKSRKQIIKMALDKLLKIGEISSDTNWTFINV